MNGSWSAVYDSLPPTQPIDVSQVAASPQHGRGDGPSGDVRPEAGGSGDGPDQADRSVTIGRF